MSCGSKDSDKVHEEVQDYYGKVLQSNEDLKTNVCTLGKKNMPKHVREAIASVHEEVASRFYGCGLVIPEAIEGASVLDLGSGAGLDCFALGSLVGEKGHVTGVDMTQEQLDIANKYIAYHTEKFGYSKPNVNFLKGFIEKLSEAGVQENHYDIIISNCVVNLSTDKRAVLQGAYKSLKVGGEMYFSDIYADRDLQEDIRKHKVLWGECIAGALDWKELNRLAKEVGFSTPRMVTSSLFQITKPELNEILGDAKFVSATYRLFKLPAEREKPCSVIYEGSIPQHEDEWALDHENKFKKGEPRTVTGEVATILKASRFADDMTFEPPQKVSCCAGKTCEEKPVDPVAFALAAGEVSPCCGVENGASSAPSCCIATSKEGATGGCC